MHLLKEKLRLIYLPFLLINLCFIVVYTFLHWVLAVQLKLIDYDEITTHFWLPIATCWIPVIIWLRPAINLLKKTTPGETPSFGFQLFISIVIAATTMVAQFYMDSATGVLTQLDNIDQIDSNHLTKFYTVKHFYVDTVNKNILYTYETKNKGRDRNLSMYIVSPLDEYGKEIKATKIGYITDNSISLSKNKTIDSTIITEPPSEISLVTAKAWVCISYNKTISAKLSSHETKSEEDKFYNECQENFAKTNLKKLVYFDRIGKSNSYNFYKTAILRKSIRKDFANNPPVIFEPRFESFEHRNGNKPAWVAGSFAIGATIVFLLLLSVKFDELKLTEFIKKKYS